MKSKSNKMFRLQIFILELKDKNFTYTRLLQLKSVISKFSLKFSDQINSRIVGQLLSSPCSSPFPCVSLRKRLSSI